MPRKALRKALAVALSRKMADGEVTVVSGLAFDKPSTKAYRKLLEAADAGHAPLLVTAGKADANLLLSSRNLPGSRVLPAAELNARDVAACTRLLLAEGAFDAHRRPPRRRSLPMSALDARSVILRPVVTEKTLRVSERRNAYTFEVHPDANKIQVRLAVEELFKVKVDRRAHGPAQGQAPPGRLERDEDPDVEARRRDPEGRPVHRRLLTSHRIPRSKRRRGLPRRPRSAESAEPEPEDAHPPRTTDEQRNAPDHVPRQRRPDARQGAREAPPRAHAQVAAAATTTAA